MHPAPHYGPGRHAPFRLHDQKGVIQMIRFPKYLNLVAPSMASLVLVWAAGCGGGSGSTASSAGVQSATPSASTTTQVPMPPVSVDPLAIVTPAGPATVGGLAAVNLRTAANYVILAESGITNVPSSAITGNLGVSPIAATAMTGFGLIRAADGTYATSAEVTGKIYAASYTSPTPTKLTEAVGDMQTAYLDAAGRPVTPANTNRGGGEIGGLTLIPGVYRWSTAVAITKNVTLRGSSNDVWIFQIAGGVTQASATQVILAGGAQAKNVFWQVGGVVAIGTTAHMVGEVMSKTAITLNTGASANGRLLAHTNVTLIKNAIVQE